MDLKKTARIVGLSAAAVILSASATLAATATASVNVRTGPGTQFRAIDTLYPGERVGILDRDGGWCAIEKSGPNGWVSCRYLTSDNSYVVRPGVSIQFGIGSMPRHHRHSDWDNHNHRNGGYWSGPRSSTYSNGSGYFGLSIGN